MSESGIELSTKSENRKFLTLTTTTAHQLKSHHQLKQTVINKRIHNQNNLSRQNSHNSEETKSSSCLPFLSGFISVSIVSFFRRRDNRERESVSISLFSELLFEL